MENKIKSVFRRRDVEKIYTIGGTYGHLCSERSGKTLMDKQIGEYEIDIPLLEKGDKFYLSDIQEEVIIESRMRGSNGTTVYYVKDKMVETEHTARTYIECMVQIKQLDYDEDKIEKLENEIRALKQDVRDAENKFRKLEDNYKWYRNTYKYEHRFFNSKSNQVKFIDETELGNK